MQWTVPFQRRATEYQTLVLGTGTQLWKQELYPAFHPAECKTAGGIADAFKPLKSLDLDSDWGCDVFETRYPIMVQNVARFIANSGFTGHVVFVSTPPAVRGCDAVAFPNARPPARAPLSQRSAGTPPNAEYYYERPRYAEVVWWSAFRKWAPRVKFSVLNVTHLSETRADARVPSDCEHYCMPGLPHVWAEMLLRLLEQHHFRY